MIIWCHNYCCFYVHLFFFQVLLFYCHQLRSSAPHHAWTYTSNQRLAAPHSYSIIACCWNILCIMVCSVIYICCICAKSVHMGYFIWAHEWMWGLCHSVTAGLFHHMKRTSFFLSALVCPCVFFFYVVLHLSLPHPLSSFSSLVWAFSLLSFLPSFLPSFFSSFLPRGRGDLNFEQKAEEAKLCENIWSVFPPSLFWEMSSTPKEQFQKKQKVAD